MPVTLSGNTIIRNNTAAQPVFTPAYLFAGGVQGAWYDPSDSSTLFTTSAGTTPCAAPGAGAQVLVGRMLDKSGNGNHAIAANDTDKRPELSARVNLLLRSEELGGGSTAGTWANFDSTYSANTAVAPDGTITADSLIETTANSSHIIYLVGGTTVAAASYVGSFFVKRRSNTDCQWCFVNIYNGNNPTASAARVYFDIENGVVGTVGAGATASIRSAGNGWWQCFVTRTLAAGNVGSGAEAYCIVGTAFADGVSSFVGDVNKGLYIWGADLRPANIGALVPTYQRIADQYTYDTAGFPRYLRFDGVDDAMSTPANVNLSSTDKVTVFAGVRKLSAATTNVVVELRNPALSATSYFSVFAPSGAANNYAFRSAGTIEITATTANAYTPPVTNVLTGIGDIANDICVLNVNSVQAANSASDQGTGNYSNQPLFIGARNNASLFFNGYLYSLIVMGAASSASQITQTETWVAEKTGISIP